MGEKTDLLYLSHMGYSLNVRVQVRLFVLKALKNYLQVMRQDGDQVHGCQHATPKTLEVRGGQQAQNVLQGEEGDADGFHILTVESAAGLA